MGGLLSTCLPWDQQPMVHGGWWVYKMWWNLSGRQVTSCGYQGLERPGLHHHKHMQRPRPMYTLHTAQLNIARSRRPRNQRNRMRPPLCKPRDSLRHQPYHLFRLYHTQMQIRHQRKRPPTLMQTAIQNNRPRLRNGESTASEHPRTFVKLINGERRIIAQDCHTAGNPLAGHINRNYELHDPMLLAGIG